MTQDDLRVGDTDRDTALELLREAYADGRLDQGEFDERASGVLAAKTYGGLTELLADLPVAPERLPAPPTFRAGRVRPSSARGAAGSPSSAVARRNAAAARRPGRRQTAEQRRRSLVASMLALLVMLTGGAFMATAPVTDVYADSYSTGAQYDAFGAVQVNEIAMLSSGSHVGYEVLRHDGPAAVLTVTAAADAFVVVRVDDGGITRTSGYGSVDVLLPAGSQAVEVDTDAEWSYEVKPLAADAAPADAAPAP